ncbi:MAG TPA: LuxR C-terminal-related transcriptional regulator, partial [Fimbriimonas sp.]
MLQSGFRFSRQEEKVLALSMSGLSDKEIAQRMEIGLGTVRTFWKRIRSKAGGSTRAEVIGAITRVAADQEFEV